MANLISKANSSKYADKGELADNTIHFCVLDVELTDGEFGERWELEIFLPQEELKTISFTRTEKRDALFEAMKEDLPQHDCWLVRWNFKGKSGYRLDQRSGGGSCACTPDAPVSDNPFLPDYPDDGPIETPAPKPAANTLGNAPASPKQYVAIGKLAEKLNIDVDMPETFGEAAALITRLEHDYTRATLQLNRRETKLEHGVPMAG